MIKKILFFFIFFMLISTIQNSPSAFAEEINVTEGIKNCAQISGLSDRLICYDAIAGDLDFFSEEDIKKTDQTLKKTGFWDASKKKMPSGEEAMYLKNKAITSAVSSTGTEYNPVLTIMCQHGETDLYIDWLHEIKVPPKQGLFTFKLSYQFDAESKINDTWELSTDRQALFSPDPVSLIKKMRQHKKLVFFVAPPKEPSESVVYDLSGINDVLSLLVKECYN